MVSLAIAANFARELTEEQFAERAPGRRIEEQFAERPPGTRRASRSPVERPAAEPARARPTPLGRALTRLAQVRG
jgi:hypothetical protein